MGLVVQITQVMCPSIICKRFDVIPLKSLFVSLYGRHVYRSTLLGLAAVVALKSQTCFVCSLGILHLTFLFQS